jgi:hypothetical protein
MGHCRRVLRNFIAAVLALGGGHRAPSRLIGVDASPALNGVLCASWSSVTEACQESNSWNSTFE